MYHSEVTLLIKMAFCLFRKRMNEMCDEHELYDESEEDEGCINKHIKVTHSILKYASVSKAVA